MRIPLASRLPIKIACIKFAVSFQSVIVAFFMQSNFSHEINLLLTYQDILPEKPSRLVTGTYDFPVNRCWFFSSGRYYIGLSDWYEEGVYRWKEKTDKATYFNWKTGYPQDYNIEKYRNCVVISTNPSDNYKKWTTVECSNSWNFICECEGACS